MSDVKINSAIINTASKRRVNYFMQPSQTAKLWSCWLCIYAVYRATCALAVAFKARTSLTPSKWRHFYKARTKLLAYGNDMYSACWGYRGVLYVLAIHICPHFVCVDALIVVTLIYFCTLFHTPFTRVSLLWMQRLLGVWECGCGGCICNPIFPRTMMWQHTDTLRILHLRGPINVSSHNIG